jgi:hypothetical protein
LALPTTKLAELPKIFQSAVSICARRGEQIIQKEGHDLLDNLILNRMAPKTQIAYLGAITGLAQYYNLSPDKLSNDQIQQYLVYLIRHGKLK